MVEPARLDALRRQFAEDPRRYFAPLASALRRAGDPVGAAALTRAQLAVYPEHLTGHVILGHALTDAGDQDGARQAFERAHAVDAGNPVVLEALVGIARQAGDQQGAAHWVARLREADPEHPMAAPDLAFEPIDLDAFGADDDGAFAEGLPTSGDGPGAPAAFSAAALDPRLAVDVPGHDAPGHGALPRHRPTTPLTRWGELWSDSMSPPRTRCPRRCAPRCRNCSTTRCTRRPAW
jgi:predicted Zn-dependent protease